MHDLLRLTVLFAFVSSTISPALAQRPAGTAKLSLKGDGVSMSGEYPTTLCGSPYMLGKGMAYQVSAGDLRITIASESRASGAVPLNRKDGGINVVATVNGGGKNLVRGPRNAGTLVVSDDFTRAEATLELRSITGPATATLIATFVCQ
jgi:hypothetical protein